MSAEAGGCIKGTDLPEGCFQWDQLLPWGPWSENGKEALRLDANRCHTGVGHPSHIVGNQ